MRRHWRDWGKIAAGKAGVGLQSLLGPRRVVPLNILVYHRVTPHVPGLPAPSINVTPEQFEAQLGGLLRRGYRFWPLQKVLAERAQGASLPPQTVVLTFDDVFESVYEYAWPIMRRLQTPSTMFVSTAYLDSRDPFPFDRWGLAHRDSAPSVAYRPLTVAQCREMQQSGLVEIAPHTHTHQDYRQRPDELQRDLQLSVDRVLELFGPGPLTFAFPFGRRSLGYVTEATLAAARRTGVICALTTDSGSVDLADDPFGWPRFNAYEWDTAATLSAKFAGWYNWAPRLEERLSRVPVSTP